MVFCPKCHTSLHEEANFCHKCGTKVHIPLSDCPNCQKLNPADAAFCYGCAASLRPLDLSEVDFNTKNSKFNFANPYLLEEQIRNLFFEELRRLVAYINTEAYTEYLQSLVSNGGLELVSRRSRQLADEMHEIAAQNLPPSVSSLEKRINDDVNAWAIYAIVDNVQKINNIHIAEKILRYEKASIKKFDLAQMISDYLNFEQERERVYTDFIKMPTIALQNAAKNFLFAAKGEHIYFIVDKGTFQQAKEGFAMTEFGIYWKAQGQKAQSVSYHNIKNLASKNGSVFINDNFFFVSPTLNIKILLLLDKLRRIYG